MDGLEMIPDYHSTDLTQVCPLLGCATSDQIGLILMTLLLLISSQSGHEQLKNHIYYAHMKPLP
jgi:hypothetical protein